VYPGTVEDPRIKPIRFLVSMKRRHPEYSTKRMQVDYLFFAFDLISLALACLLMFCVVIFGKEID
jgi:hypothetical protein